MTEPVKTYTRREQERWERFEQSCLSAGIDENSFHGMKDVFEEFEKYKKWRNGRKRMTKEGGEIN